MTIPGVGNKFALKIIVSPQSRESSWAHLICTIGVYVELKVHTHLYIHLYT